MKKIYCLIFLLCFFECSFCQDSSWKEVRIDSFLTISLPQDFKISDTSLVRNDVIYKARTFKANTEFAFLAVTIIQTDLNINPYQLTSDPMKQGYEGVKSGFKKRAEDQGFSLDMKDTIVSTVQGFKANIFTDDRKVKLSRMSYFFCINSLSYLIAAVPLENNVSQCSTTMEQLVKSIRFNKQEILAHASSVNSSNSLFDRSEKVGELLAPILLIGGIVIFFIYKNRKKKNVV
jgi:hypothetical protein